jgi:hypothetical protein
LEDGEDDGWAEAGWCDLVVVVVVVVVVMPMSALAADESFRRETMRSRREIFRRP